MRFRSALALVSLTLSASRAVAQDDTAIASAYQFSAEGIQALDEDRAEEALTKFSSAYAIVKLPSLAVLTARAQLKLGHLVAASDLYEQAQSLSDGLGDPEVQRRARDEAKVEQEALKRRIPRVFVQVAGVSKDSVVVKLDTIQLPTSALSAGYPVDPGTHLLIAQVGSRTQNLVASVEEGEAKTLFVNFQPETSPVLPRPPPSSTDPIQRNRPLRTASWVSLATGGAALTVSGVTAIWAMSKARSLNEGGSWRVTNCENAWDTSGCNQYRQIRTVSTIGFYTGLVGVATGAILYVASPSTRRATGSAPRLNAWLGVGTAELVGQF